MERGAAIFVAGDDTLLGAAICRALERQGHELVNRWVSPVDLTDPAQVETFFARWAPRYVFLAGGPSGGIGLNQRRPADLLHDNLVIAANVIDAARRHRTRKLLYLASSCVYPSSAPQPMHEGLLLTGALEPSSEAYAVARIAGIKLCQAYRRQYGLECVAAIPADAFGPEDTFDEEDSHVVPALIRRMHRAKMTGTEEVEVWGTGTPRRDFIFSRDVAEACLFLMDHYDGAEPVNISAGTDVSIRQVAEMVRDVVGFTGRVVFDRGKPDGAPVKLLDGSRLASLGWRSGTSLRRALEETYQAFLLGLEVGEGGHAQAVL